MIYETFSFVAVLIFALVHLLAPKARNMSWGSQGKFLSICGGVAISYVFIDILPKLGKNDALITKALEGSFPYFERHVFVLALLGFLLFFSVDRRQPAPKKQLLFWLSMTSYAVFNFLVGYAVVDINDVEVQPLALFTFAMALHYFTNDYSLNESHGKAYQTKGKWILILSLFLGWITGFILTLSSTAVALMSAFIAGGIILNVTRHELPVARPNNIRAFLLSAIAYTILLLLLRT